MRRTGVVLLFLLVSVFTVVANAERVITGYDGRQFVFPETDEQVLERALDAARNEGYTFEMLTASYTRMLTTLVNLGFSTDDVNRITPLVAARKGVRVSENPGRDTPDPLPWHVELADDVQRLQDVLWSRGTLFRDFAETAARSKGSSFGPTEMRDAFRVETSRHLDAMILEYTTAIAAVEDRIPSTVEGERNFVRALRESVYDYQNARWETQCSVAQSKFAEYWKELKLEGSNQQLQSALKQATSEALARLQRRSLATVVTGDESVVPRTDDDSSFLAVVKQSFRSMIIAGPVAQPTQQVHYVTDTVLTQEREAQAEAVVEYTRQDITASVCALYHALRRIILAAAGHDFDDYVLQSVRNLILYFKSSVQREVPSHFAPFFDADLVVVDATTLLRATTVTIRLVYEELRREFPGENHRLQSFPSFYRSVFEEATFLGHFFDQQFVRFLHRDVPEGSVVVLVIPEEECRDKHFNNGTIETDECQAVFSQLSATLVALQVEPLAVIYAQETYPSNSPILNLPLDTPTRTVIPDMFKQQWDLARTELRVKYRVAVYQWGPPRPQDERDAAPSFGDEIDAMIRAETEAGMELRGTNYDEL